MIMTKLNLVVNIEVAEDKGEDANLFDRDFRENILMGVFDGLGGRSAGYGGKTGGRIASEVASQLSQKFFKQWNGKITPENVILLQQEICRSLKILADTNMSRTSSRLKGSLMEHKLCTTIALASILKQQGQEKIFEADLAWMGDSRIYFLSPTKGLQQLTKDDLVTPKDALEMLRQDPPMSQFLTADLNPRWQIHYQRHIIEEPGCFLACTDGCFQYFSAPWEFEKLLVETLLQSIGDKITDNNWDKLLSQKYTQIKQDDVSLVLSVVGFYNIKELKNYYRQRLQYLQENFISPTANTPYEDLQNLWEKYRINYEHYLPFIQDIQPTANSQPPVSEAKPSPASSTSSSLSTNKFQEITQSSKDKATANAEKIKSLLDRANSCYDNNQLKEALDWCNQVLDIEPHQSECKYLLGLIYTKSACLEIDSCQKEALFKKAALYWENEVIKFYGKTLIDSYLNLGFIYYNLSEWQKAVDSYRKYFKLLLEAKEKLHDWEKFHDWEEHLEAFVTSLNLISNKYEPSNVAIQFCQRLANLFAVGKKAYPYYFMALLHEIRGDLSAAFNNIQIAMNIYDRLHSTEVNYESRLKAQQKYRQIQNKYYYSR
jgi:serine/threonine protein phosphatase PrpC